VSTKGILLLRSTKYEKLPGLDIVHFSYINHYNTKHVDQVEVWLLDVYNQVCRQRRINERKVHQGKVVTARPPNA